MNISEVREYARPEALHAALTARSDELRQAAHMHHPAHQESVRTTTHRGHEIVVRTRYSITVDGRPFDVRPSATNAGLVHYHGLPTQSFESVMDSAGPRSRARTSCAFWGASCSAMRTCRRRCVCSCSARGRNQYLLTQ